MVASRRADNHIPKHNLRDHACASVVWYTARDADNKDVFNVRKAGAHLLGKDASLTEAALPLHSDNDFVLSNATA